MATDHSTRLPRSPLGEEGLPLYTKTATRILADLREGGARTGDRLPSERRLCERYAVSRVTARAALTELLDRGVVTASASRGWFVAELGPDVPTMPAGATVRGFADFAADNGLAVRARILTARARPATVEEAQTLRIAPGAELFEMQRVRYLDDLVVVVEHNRLPLHLCPGLVDVDFSVGSLYATLRESDPPQIPKVADYSVEARNPSPVEQELLELDASTPLLVATQLAYNQAGRPMELTVAAYRGDRYRFTASITNADR